MVQMDEHSRSDNELGDVKVNGQVGMDHETRQVATEQVASLITRGADKAFEICEGQLVVHVGSSADRSPGSWDVVKGATSAPSWRS